MKKTSMKGKTEIWDVGIWKNRALKITLIYQISSELRLSFFPNLWKNAAIFPIPPVPVPVPKRWKSHCKNLHIMTVRKN